MREDDPRSGKVLQFPGCAPAPEPLLPSPNVSEPLRALVVEAVILAGGDLSSAERMCRDAADQLGERRGPFLDVEPLD